MLVDVIVLACVGVQATRTVLETEQMAREVRRMHRMRQTVLK